MLTRTGLLCHFIQGVTVLTVIHSPKTFRTLIAIAQKKTFLQEGIFHELFSDEFKVENDHCIKMIVFAHPEKNAFL